MAKTITITMTMPEEYPIAIQQLGVEVGIRNNSGVVRYMVDEFAKKYPSVAKQLNKHK